MHPMSPALSAMVSRTAAQASHTAETPTDPGDLEIAIRHALADLSRTRPRIVTFAPHVALQRVLNMSPLRQRVRRARASADPAWAQAHP